jgi:acetoin utilization deacetylase AcuC-like enzyme
MANKKNDWGGFLLPENYQEIVKLVSETSRWSGAGCFAVLEGGYNQGVF